MWCTIIWTATEWANFFGQRYHPAAHPAFQKIAQMIYEEQQQSTPRELRENEWHLPLWQDEDNELLSRINYGAVLDLAVNKANNADPFWSKFGNLQEIESVYSMSRFEEFVKQDVATGRCTRVSYLTHHGTRDLIEDILLAVRLSASVPGHWSPFEHCATPADISELSGTPKQFVFDGGGTPYYPDGFCGSYRGWKPYRKFFKNENILEFKK
jgi:hypothetical protein